MSILKINFKAIVLSFSLSFFPLLIWFIGFNYAFIKSGWGFNNWSVLFLIVGSFMSIKIYREIKGIF